MTNRPKLTLLQGGCTPPARPRQVAAVATYASFVHVDSRPGMSYVESKGEILPIVTFLDAAGQSFDVKRRADVERIARVYAGKGDRWVWVDVLSKEILP